MNHTDDNSHILRHYSLKQNISLPVKKKKKKNTDKTWWDVTWRDVECEFKARLMERWRDTMKRARNGTANQLRNSEASCLSVLWAAAEEIVTASHTSNWVKFVAINAQKIHECEWRKLHKREWIPSRQEMQLTRLKEKKNLYRFISCWRQSFSFIPAFTIRTAV